LIWSWQLLPLPTTLRTLPGRSSYSKDNSFEFWPVRDNPDIFMNLLILLRNVCQLKQENIPTSGMLHSESFEFTSQKEIWLIWSVVLFTEIFKLYSIATFLVQWYSTFFFRVPPDIIYLQLRIPKFFYVLVYFKSYIVYNLHIK
jgi:hypothetical protein